MPIATDDVSGGACFPTTLSIFFLEFVIYTGQFGPVPTFFEREYPLCAKTYKVGSIQSFDQQGFPVFTEGLDAALVFGNPNVALTCPSRECTLEYADTEASDITLGGSHVAAYSFQDLINLFGPDTGKPIADGLRVEGITFTTSANVVGFLGSIVLETPARGVLIKDCTFKDMKKAERVFVSRYTLGDDDESVDKHVPYADVRIEGNTFEVSNKHGLLTIPMVIPWIYCSPPLFYKSLHFLCQ